jgi:hypothetical protein
MNNRPTPETDAARHDLSDYGSPVLCSWGDWVEADFARKLERERDEARESLKHISEYGTEEINAAIDLRRNLAQALVDLDDMQGQRDEARKDADHWKIEYEIVVARLCGKRHRRDNGIVSEDEVIPKLIRALEWVADRYDDAKPIHQVAMDAYEMSCAAKAVLRNKEEK